MEIIPDRPPHVRDQNYNPVYRVLAFDDTDADMSIAPRTVMRVFGGDLVDVIDEAEKLAPRGSLIAVAVETPSPQSFDAGDVLLTWIHGFDPVSSGDRNDERYRRMRGRALRDD